MRNFININKFILAILLELCLMSSPINAMNYNNSSEEDIQNIGEDELHDEINDYIWEIFKSSGDLNCISKLLANDKIFMSLDFVIIEPIFLYACKKGNVEFLKLCLKKGILERDSTTKYFLVNYFKEAIDNGHLNIVDILINDNFIESLIEQNEKISSELLLLAAEKDCLQLFEKNLFRNNQAIQEKINFILFIVSRNRSINVLHFLLNNSCSNFITEDGASDAIWVASRRGYKDILNLLLGNIKITSLINEQIATNILSAAFDTEHYNIVLWLLCKDEIKKFINDNLANFIFIWACDNSKKEILNLMIINFAVVINRETQKKAYRIGISKAENFNNLEIIKILFENFIQEETELNEIFLLLCNNLHPKTLKILLDMYANRINEETLETIFRRIITSAAELSQNNEHREIVNILFNNPTIRSKLNLDSMLHWTQEVELQDTLIKILPREE
ncbi:hypothetical protein GF322_00790 [Candidatus Dependentiae bacterium]|nr:hypothetical protein [Candidatus Dependentiae bacterium]